MLMDQSDWIDDRGALIHQNEKVQHKSPLAALSFNDHLFQSPTRHGKVMWVCIKHTE